LTINRRLIATLLIITVGLGVVIYAAVAPEISSGNLGGGASNSKIAVIDQLDLSSPSETFRKNVGDLLQQAKLPYDLFVGSNITVEFYRKLPSMGYRLILLRVHSGLLQPVAPDKPVYLFTGQLYDQNLYQREILNGELVPARVTTNSPAYFAVGPLFVKRDMTGTFPGTVFIISGCSALINTYLADQLLRRGASAIISWDDYVSARWTDYAIYRLMEDFAVKRMSISEAVDETMRTIGPDPYYKSTLRYYPGSAANLTLQTILSVNWPLPQTTTVSVVQPAWIPEKSTILVHVARLPTRF